MAFICKFGLCSILFQNSRTNGSKLDQREIQPSKSFCQFMHIVRNRSLLKNRTMLSIQKCDAPYTLVCVKRNLIFRAKKKSNISLTNGMSFFIINSIFIYCFQSSLQCKWLVCNKFRSKTNQLNGQKCYFQWKRVVNLWLKW